MAKPVVTTGSVSGIKITRAHLGISVDPKGKATEYWVEYGKTGAYGSETPKLKITAKEAEELAEEEEAVFETSIEVKGLAPGTVYHDLGKATNADGEGKGEDFSFETTKPIPEPEKGLDTRLSPLSPTRRILNRK
jgi:hypothetical protein